MLTRVEALALVDPNDNGWDHMGGWGGGWMWLFGLAMMVLFAVLIVWPVRVGAAPSSPATPARDPLERAREVLAERYARGELATEDASASSNDRRAAITDVPRHARRRQAGDTRSRGRQ